jgi:26S proteasome non-ATPase regulatory subunit 10
MVGAACLAAGGQPGGGGGGSGGGPAPKIALSKPTPRSPTARTMERAAESARAGDVAYFEGLAPEARARLAAPAARDADGRSLLHSAAAGGSLPLLELLVAAGAAGAVGAADDEGWTPLHSAISAGHEAAAALLLSLGAPADARTAQRRTPLHYAASRGRAPLVAALLAAGADAGARDTGGAAPAHRAAAGGHVAPLRALLAAERAPPVDARDAGGATALLLAAQAGHAPAAVLLVGAGADVAAADGEGDTPLAAAARHGGGLREALEAVAAGIGDVEEMLR